MTNPNYHPSNLAEPPTDHAERIREQEPIEPFDAATYPNGLGSAMQSDEALAAWDKKYGFKPVP